ncbi:lipopolysaccharide biosynthesis protein [Cytobacillus gottheilii]|uniref:lipopolysaccharide biosynthesis protein n=1 Tax=Cytobacillus gottheilii TaxID=859144 RepID=UPI0024943246|nr:oligosaccharide flippase family protein [Cytobacillus gottheilii]
MYKVLLKKFLSFSIGNWITMIIAISTTPIITRLFEPAVFGMYSMYTLVINIILIISILGSDQSYMRYFNTVENKAALLFKCLKISFISFFIIGIVAFIFRTQLSIFIISKNDIVLIYLIIAGLFINMINRFMLTVIRMKQNAKLYSFVSVSTKITEVSLIITFFFNVGETVYSLIFASIISNLVIMIFLIFNNRKLISGIKSKSNITTKEILGYGIPFTFSLIVFWLFESIDKISLRQFSSLEELGLFAAAMKLVGIVVIIQASFQTFWTPVALEKFERKNEERFFSNINLIVGFVMLVMGIAIIFSSDIVKVILGENYNSVSDILPFLLLGPIMYTVSETTVMGINFYKKTGWHIVIAVIACISNIIGNLLLVPSLGAKGAAISTGISYIVFFVMRTNISSRFFKVDYQIKKYYLGTLILVLYALYATLYNASLLHYLMGIVSLLLLFLIYLKDLREIINFIKKSK